MKNKFSKFINLQGKYLTSLLILLALSIGYAWGEDATFTMSSIFTGSNTSATLTSPVNASAATTSNAGNANQGKLSNDGNYFEIVLSDKTFTAASFNGYINTTNTSKNWAFQFTTDGGTNWASEVTQANDGTKSAHDIAVGVTIPSGANGIRIVRRAGTSTFVYSITLTLASTTKYKVTYKAGDGTGSDVEDSDAKEVKAFADCSFTAPTGYEFKEWQDESSNVVAEGATVSSNMTLTAIYRLIPTKYAVTYDLNGASGEAPTETNKAENDVFSLAAAPSWAGHAFDGWLCNIDSEVKAAGASYTMTAAATTFTAQWHEVDCKIYSFTGGIGSAEVTAATATVDADALILSNSSARIKLTPASGETFKAGDVITISGFTGNASKKFGVYVKNAAGSSNIATAEETNLGDGYASATLSADAEYVFLARKEGTTMTVLTCEIHRACAEGVAAGLSYATASVDKSTTDAAFTNPLTNANSLIVAGYSTSDATVATVDKAGLVTIVGAGSATITAYSATQTKAGTLYAAGTASYTLTVTAPPTYAVTYAANGGEGTMTDPNSPYLEGAEVTLLANAFTAPTSQEFDAWVVTETVSGDPVSVSAGKFTMPAVDVTVTATWRAVTEKYIVHYMDEDGTTPLGADEQVVVGQNPVGLAVTKPLFTLAAWQLSGSDIALDDASWASVAANAEVTLTARWAKAYASNADFEAYIIANKSEKDDADKAEAYVKSLNYALSTKTGTTFDANDETNNGAYAGLKIKNAGTVLSWNVVAGKVVELKAGVMVANGSLAINSGTPTTIDGGSTTSGNDNYKIHYFYSAAEALYEFTTSNGSAEVIKAITMRDPYTVSFEANGGDAVASIQGTPSVTLPSATNGTQNFAGWYDALDNFIGNAGTTYTPSADIELVAKWEALSTINTLSDLQVNDVTVDGFDPDVHTYNIVLPYGTDVNNLPKITLATPTNANATVAIFPTTGPAWTDDFGGCYRQQANVTPQDPTAAVGYNDIRITIAPKDGVSIIKVATTGSTNKTVTGLYAGEGDVNLSSSTKMDNGKYIGFTLAGTTLQAGDQINVHTTTAANTANSHIIFYDNMTDKNELYETGEIGGLGDNIFTINAAMVGQASAYVYRANNDAAHQWNGYVDFIEVTRPMNPVLTAITIDGRDGVIDEANKTVAVSFPYESDLASLDVQPTIVWNGAGSAAPLAAWAEGANTYRITDKDGDYTDYTVTLTRDDLKYAVTFNTHGGSAVEPQNVKDGESPVLPTEPTREDYLFQGWAETDGGAIVDVTSFTITAAKEFHAVWAPDGAIKLLDGSTVNTTNFITGVTATTVNFDDADHNCVIFAGTVSGVNGVKDLDRVIAYNATTTQTKIQFNLYNSKGSNRTFLVKGVVEGSTNVENLASFTLAGNEKKVTEWIEFNDATNRTIYVFASSDAADIKFLQVKVIETGTALPMFGQAGYSMNLNKGRIFGRAPGAISNFEGMHVESLGADYQPTSSTVGRFYLGKSISFDVTSNVLMSITAANNKTYYVTKGAAGTDNETSKQGVSEFALTAGTWYITAGAEDMQFTNIAFTLPKCAEPAFNALANSDVCAGDPYVALNGTATVADAGVPTYQWYKEDNTPIDGATNAEYTPAEDGKYYVIAVNHLDGFSDNEKKSELVSVASVASTVINEAPKNVRKDAGEAATLTVDASGKNLHYAWKESDAIDGTYTDVAGADDAASLDVIVPTGVKFYKVVITSDCGEAIEAIAKVEEWVELSQVDVTATTEWDWVNAGENNKLSAGKNVEILMANIRENDVIPTNDATFNSQALLFYGENVRNVESGRAYASVGHISFNTTVPGAVFVEFSDNGSNNRRLSINGKLSEPSATKTDVKTFMATVPAGEVVLMGVDEDGTGENKYLRISKISFVKTDYTREVNSGRYGTICLPNGGKMYGAALYEVAYFDAASEKIFFDEVLNGEMVAGVPYIFHPNAGIDLIAVSYTDEADAPAGNMNGLYGSYERINLTANAGIYILKDNQYWFVNTDNVYCGANRAYIKLGDIPGSAPAPAPGRRRISMGVNSEKVATGLDNLNAGEQPIKVIIDGQLFILRGEQMFDATGRLVK